MMVEHNLQQQKLLWHYSLQVGAIVPSESTIVEIIMALQPNHQRVYQGTIYNSRNYYGIIARLNGILYQLKSTIVEIIMALQPASNSGCFTTYLQQQKLLWHYSLYSNTQEIHNIYNSRNYYGIIARGIRLGKEGKSTIVEIIMALQPKS